MLRFPNNTCLGGVARCGHPSPQIGALVRSFRTTRRRATAVVLGVVTATGLALLVPASASAEEGGPQAATTVSINFTGAHAQQVRVHGFGIHPGTVIVHMTNTSKTGRGLLVLSLNGSTTLGKVLNDISTDIAGGPAGAKATVRLTKEAHFVGGADVAPGQQLTYTTVGLPRGHYYAIDPTHASPRRAPAVLSSFSVSGDSRRSDDPDSRVAVYANSNDRFVPSSTTLPAKGTVLFRNISDTIHFLLLIPVKTGTTDAQIQRYFDSGSQQPPPFLKAGPNATTEVVSPGVAEKLSYNLPAGDYVLLCFVTDDMTGAPHAVMGMHKVVHLR